MPGEPQNAVSEQEGLLMQSDVKEASPHFT